MNPHALRLAGALLAIAAAARGWPAWDIARFILPWFCIGLLAGAAITTAIAYLQPI